MVAGAVGGTVVPETVVTGACGEFGAVDPDRLRFIANTAIAAAASNAPPMSMGALLRAASISTRAVAAGAMAFAPWFTPCVAA